MFLKKLISRYIGEATVFLLLLSISSLGLANGVESKMEAFVVKTNIDGEETFINAEEAEPGDIIEFRIR